MLKIRRVGISLALLGMTACQTGPMLMAYKAGSTGAQRQFDFDQCKIASLREIPQAMATDFRPGYYNPGTVQCQTIGTNVKYTYCNRIGAVNVPPSATTYDANEGLRGRFLERCMAAKGYVPLNRPICPTESERQTAYSAPQPASPAEVTCSAGVPLDS